jgi:hypothetical protein
MKVFAAAAICLFLGAGAALMAQDTVTNSDLEAFRQKRLAAEKRYRENYERLGMPSPDELERRRVANLKETEELSNKLRNERLEREAWAAEMERRRILQQRLILESGPTYIIGNQPYYGGGYYYYPNYRGRRFYRPLRGTTWRAGGGGVIYEPGGRSSYVWPAPTTVRVPRFRR